MNFTVGRLPRIEFGRGVIQKLVPAIRRHGHHVLLLTGARSFIASAAWQTLTNDLQRAAIHCCHITVKHEPTADFIDDCVDRLVDQPVDVVVGIGGGSVLDAAKAIAGLLRSGDSVMNYLEGVGPELPYQGPAVPLIAVPTTAGTGSEMTRNAVLGRHGEDGFKKSFRHEQLVAELALIDADLLHGCPRQSIAANGMDALTQLLESRVSVKSNRLMSVLAEDGLRAVRDGLLPWYEEQYPDVSEARALMAYAALLSGITLAHVGLGSVHGLAAPLGALYPIPHGIVCGTLLAEATAVNIGALEQRRPGSPALAAYARCAEILLQRRFNSVTEACAKLVALLYDWRQRLALPGLSRFGVDTGDIDRIVAGARGNSMKTNPVDLTDAELRDLLLRCL